MSSAAAIHALDWDSGTGLKGYVWRAATPRAPLLILHGYAEHTMRYVESHSRLIPRLVASGFDVYAFDMQGHGSSPGRRGSVDVAEMVEAHIKARTAIAAHGEPLFLLGHSLGGLVTAASVARDPHGIAGVVLSSPALLIEASAPLRLLARILSRIAPGLGVRRASPASGLTRIADEVAAFQADPMIYRGSVQAITGISLVDTSRIHWPKYSDWKASTLILHGTDDRFVGYKASKDFYEAIKSHDKELMTVEDGYHELLNDLDREKVLERLMAWLCQRLPAATAPR